MKKRLILLSLLVVLTVSGCSGGKKTPKNEQPEILLAQDCGLDLLPCCASDPTCNFGQQCCVDPNNHNRNHCADSCACGGEDQFCCEGDQCSEGLACRDGVCSHCGDEGDVCCPSEAPCSPGLVCSEDECVQCGLLGNPCCVGSEPCVIGKGENNECYEGYCRSCGFDGAPACSGGSICLDGQLLTGGRCERCGEANNPCCSSSSSAYVCDPKDDLECKLGFCSKK